MDSASFEEMFREHVAGLVRFTASYVHDMEVARELVSELFLNLWQNRDDWNPEHGVGVYLYGAARNRALNYLRSEKRRSRFADSAEQEIDPPGQSARPLSADSEIEREELERAVNQAIDSLPEPRRQVVILRWREQMSAPEIAKILGISQGAVYQLLNRSHDLLRKLLGPSIR